MWNNTGSMYLPGKLAHWICRDWRSLAIGAAAGALTLAWPAVCAVPAGVLLLAIEFVNWLQSIGREIRLQGILKITILLSMWVMPAIAYRGSGESWYTGHTMPVAADTYWLLAVPGVLGILWALNRPYSIPDRPRYAIEPLPTCIFLMILGLSGQIALPYMPSNGYFAVFLVSQLLFPAVCYGMQINAEHRWWWVLAGSLVAGVLALRTTYFGAGTLWILFMLVFVLKGRNIRNRYRYGAAAAAGLALLILFSFKYEYRKIVQRQGTTVPRIQTFLALLSRQLIDPQKWLGTETVETVINRFNQGFYTAQVMAWTPLHEPFAQGQTLKSDAWAILVPRFLDPQKHRAGGVDNMQRFAGVSGRSYSMNIGIFGEAYANFGIAGGVICLLGYGLLISALMALAGCYLNAAWWPFIFIPALHVESDMGIVCNHIFKSGLIVLLVHLIWMLKQKSKLRSLH